MRHKEDDECKALWQWAQLIPELKASLYHIPNGGRRNLLEAARMKSHGVRAGVSDYHLPIARGSYIGLWVEMKAPRSHKSVVSDSQKVWLELMKSNAHATFVCYGWHEAKAVFEWYLSLPESARESIPVPTIGKLKSSK